MHGQMEMRVCNRNNTMFTGNL